MAKSDRHTSKNEKGNILQRSIRHIYPLEIFTSHQEDENQETSQETSQRESKEPAKAKIKPIFRRKIQLTSSDIGPVFKTFN